MSISGQLSFDAVPEARPNNRLFFGTFPDPPVAKRISQLAQRIRSELGLTGSLLHAHRLHITLHHLGDYDGVPGHVVERALQAASAVSLAPFEVTFDRTASFSRRMGKNPFVLRGGEGAGTLATLHEAIGIAMQGAGLARLVKPQFTPHMTLLYDKRLAAEQMVEPISWTVREFVLVHSLLGQTRHILLARWPLREAT